MSETQYAQIVGEHLVLPKGVLRDFNLVEGTKLELLAADEGMLVLKLIDSPAERTSVTESDLRLQQMAVAKIWDHPDEDIYNDDLSTNPVSDATVTAIG